LHDFNPGITANGVFWIVPVPDDAIEITADSITLNLQNVAVVDQFQFPGGTGNVPATFTYSATYVKSGAPRVVVPKSHDPLSPLNWAGKMWAAINSGTFSVAYSDGSFSAQGSFDSTGNFGEMGTERNGRFVDANEDSAQAELRPMQLDQSGAEHQSSVNGKEGRLSNLLQFKGRVPLKELTHSTPARANR
jgi:hypothetical protein